MFRKQPPTAVQAPLDLELPRELQEGFQENVTQFNRGQQPTAVVSAPPPKRKSGPAIPIHIKEAAIAVALWGFVWVLIRSVGLGLEIDLPPWAMALPLGVVVVVSLVRPCGATYWRTVAYALLGYYLAVLLVA